MFNYLIIFGLVTLSAIFSGLNLGLMSLSPHELFRKISLGDTKAKKIYAVRRKGNLLLVTLLLGNVAVNAAISIYLGEISSGLIAGLVATGLITLFGEITPQALFSRFSMELGSRTVWLVKIFLVLLYPVSKPLAMILDKLLGDELPELYSKKELVRILEEHSDSKESDVESHEERIATGALTYAEKKVYEVMTPRSVVVFLEDKEKLNARTLSKLKKAGHSRFPVYSGSIDNIVGVLLIRDIVGMQNPKKTVGELCRKHPKFVNKNDFLDDALKAFIKTKTHLFVAVNEFYEVEGIITIEDVLEEIIRDEIMDEFDRYDDLRLVAEKKSRSVTVSKKSLVRNDQFS